MKSGEVVICTDNKRVVIEYQKQIRKESEVTTEAAEIITKIREEIKKARIDISLELSSNKSREDRLFRQQPGPILIKQYNLASKEKQKALINSNIQNEVKYKGILALIKIEKYQIKI